MRIKPVLISILVVASLTRLLFLGQYPNGFTGDEAQQGYSAYSILKTGKDEWGEVLPIFPRGFGDFKPPLYTYLTTPSVAIFGLTVEAVRLPAALIGILSVLVVFFLAKKLINEKVALWSAFLLAISPWHIQLSRTAFEGGLGVLTFSLFLLYFLKNTPKNYLLASIFAGLTLYTYHSWRLFIALFIIGLLIFYRKKIIVKKNWLPALVLAIFILPLLLNLNSILARSADVGITKQVASYFENKEVSSLPPTIDRAFNNKVLFIKDEFFKNYLSYFSPEFFFTGARSDSSYLNFPGFELLYLFEVIFWIFAGFIIFKEKEYRKILLLWFLLAPIPASLASGGMSANRAPTFLPVTTKISGIGLVGLIDWLNQKQFKKYKSLILPILTISFLYFLYFYLFKLPNHPPFNLRYGYDQVFEKVLEVEGQYDHIVISKAFTEPQIFIAFYSQMDPLVFQEASRDWLRYEKANRQYIDQLESWNLGTKFLFEGVDWKRKDSQRQNALIVSEKRDFPEDQESILDVKNPKGEIIYRLVPTNAD